jgi:hypothetical protein
MLETVKEYIKSLPNITFNNYYKQYMLDVQDRNLEAEFKQIENSHRTDIKFMDKLVKNTLKGLV